VKVSGGRAEVWPLPGLSPAGTHHPEVGQAAFVCEEEVKRGKAGLDGQDVDRGARETVRRPPLDLMPEGRQLSRHMDSRFAHVHAIAEDREKERGCQPMAQERGEAHPRGGEPLDGHESSLVLRQPFREVRGCRDRGREPISKPSDLLFRGED